NEHQEEENERAPDGVREYAVQAVGPRHRPALGALDAVGGDLPDPGVTSPGLNSRHATPGRSQALPGGADALDQESGRRRSAAPETLFGVTADVNQETADEAARDGRPEVGT